MLNFEVELRACGTGTNQSLDMGSRDPRYSGLGHHVSPNKEGAGCHANQDGRHAPGCGPRIEGYVGLLSQLAGVFQSQH